MRLLLDTHAFLWWLDGDRRLSLKARRLIADETNAVLVSAASATLLHAQRAGAIADEHRDPFDRMLIAQAQLEDVALVSDDRVFDEFDVRTLW